MIQEKEKVHYLFPGDKPPLETSIKVVYVGSALLMGFIAAVIAINLFFLLSWRDLPYFPLPQTDQPPFYHLIGFWKVTIPYLSLGSYGWTLHSWDQNETLKLFAWRWMFALVSGGLVGLMTLVSFLKPVGGDKHIMGKLLLRGKEAYNDLKREFAFLSKNGRGSGLIVAAAKKYDPRIHILQDLKPGSFIELPDKIRRSHTLVTGGTGRGKTQLIYYRLVAPCYTQIRRGEVVKMLIADTPKSDYTKYFHSKDFFKIAPAEQGGVCWNISKDLTDGLLANAFWKGKIPPNEAEPIWSNAAVAVGTGCTRFLQIAAPKAWNYGMLAHILGLPGEDLDALLAEHYPEAKQILNASGETLASVMFNLGSYSQDIISLGRIYDGFDTKKCISQATAKALKGETYLHFVCTDLVRTGIDAKQDAQNMTRAIMFKGVCRLLTATNREWTWKDMAQVLAQPKAQQVALVKPHLRDDAEVKLVEGLRYSKFWAHLAKQIVHYADEWDKLEAKPCLSIRDWIMDENPKRKILILKPSETYPTLTEGLIKGILYYANSVILGRLEDSKTRRFHILIDEFQSYRNIEQFALPALQLYRSRGVSMTIAFQDLSQMVKIYGQEITDFMNSNVGNIMIAGVNDGFTANKLTELLGEKKIRKTHRHRSHDGGGNEDMQDHDEKVIYANEWNLLGANEATMNIKYLNLFGGLNPAYILDAPILDYKTRHKIKPATWIDAETEIPTFPDIEQIWGGHKVDEPTVWIHKQSQNITYIDEALDRSLNLTDL